MTPPLARELADELAVMAWEGREGFVYDEDPLATSLAEAARAAEGPGERAGAVAGSRRQLHVGRHLRHD